jgi:V8-like Glu-specific endopeptidase
MFMKKNLFILCLILANSSNSLTALAQPENSRREMDALLAKPAVVRICNGFSGVIEFDNKKEEISKISCGAGFFINPNGFIATNAHVTEFANRQQGATENEVREKFLETIIKKFAEKNNSNPDIIAQNLELSSFKYIHHVLLPSCGEPISFVVKNFGKPNGEGEDVAIIKVETNNAPSIRIATDSRQVRLQDEVTVVGYPGAADQDTTCKSFHQTSFSRGIVSAKKSDENGNPVLQLDANASWGNSGGPVLNNQGEVIGLATAIGLAKEQLPVGITFVVPATKLQEFIRDAGATNTEGSTNRLFQEGLQLYEDKCYNSAIRKFEDTKQLFPQHSEVDKLIRDSREAISSNQGRWEIFCSNNSKVFNLPGWLWVVSGGSISVIVILLIVRSRAVNSI